jgi:SAM-dependent methyltransferase
MIDRSCDLCGESDHTPIVIENGYPIVRCRSCGFIYVNRIPEIEDGKVLGEYYSGSPEEIESSRGPYAKVFEFLLDEIERRASKGTLLDVGCGYGFFLSAARERGWDVFGTELSDIAIRYASEELAIGRIVCSDLSPDLFDGHRFDAINLTNVLEHVPSPTSTLMTCREMLKPGGIIAIRVPNMVFSAVRHRLLPLARHFKYGSGGELSYLSTHPPIHLSGFSPPSLDRVLRKCGFETVEIKPSKLSDPPSKIFPYSVFEKAVSVCFGLSASRINIGPTLLAMARREI